MSFNPHFEMLRGLLKARVIELDALRAQLASAERERDELVAALKLSRELLDDSVATENAAAARVKGLERIVELARIVVAASDSDTCTWEAQTEALLALAEALNIRARAGADEGGDVSCADCAGEMVECADCRADSAYAAAHEEGRREGYAACTADGVAWAREKVRVVPDNREAVRFAIAAKALEAGEHVGAAGKGKP